MPIQERKYDVRITSRKGSAGEAEEVDRLTEECKEKALDEIKEGLGKLDYFASVISMAMETNGVTSIHILVILMYMDADMVPVGDLLYTDISDDGWCGDKVEIAVKKDAKDILTMDSNEITASEFLKEEVWTFERRLTVGYGMNEPDSGRFWERVS